MWKQSQGPHECRGMVSFAASGMESWPLKFPCSFSMLSLPNLHPNLTGQSTHLPGLSLLAERCCLPVSSHGHSHNHSWVLLQRKHCFVPAAGKTIHQTLECQSHKGPQKWSSPPPTPSCYRRTVIWPILLVNDRAGTRGSAREPRSHMINYYAWGNGLPRCVTLGNLFNISESQFLYL